MTFARPILAAFCCLLFAIPTSAAPAPGPAAAALAGHLDRAEKRAERLRRQVEHPRGRPAAAGELAELVQHLQRLQRATAELGAAGAALEARREGLLARLRRGGALREAAAPVAGGGSISGLVTGPAGQLLPNVELVAYRLGAGPVAFAASDAGGFYQLAGLADGEYLVATNFFGSSSPFLNETFDDLLCPEPGVCRVEEATRVTVAGGAAVGNIHFRLALGGRLRGRVTSLAGSPVVGAYVIAYDAFGSVARQATTDVVGRYDLGPLAPGSYRLRASSPLHVDEVYPDIPCESSCDPSSGTPIAVALSEQVNGLDFALRSLGRLSGRVTDAVSGEPLPFATVRLVNADESVGRFIDTDQLGQWAAADLPAGTYFAGAQDFGHQSQIYDGIPCPPFDCDLPKGDAIFLPDQGAVGGIDFALGRLGAISGSVRAADTLAPVPQTYVEVFDAGGFYVTSEPGGNGAYEVEGLEPETYFVATDLPFGSLYLDELWQNRPCGGGSCEVTAGDPVNVVAEETTAGIDFTVEKLGVIEGRVVASAGGAPLAELQVTAYDAADGDPVATVETDAAGYYRLTRLPPGSYKVAVGRSAYRAEVYDGIPCGETCDLSLGQNVTAGLNQVATGIDFALERLGSLSGIVRDQTTQLPLAGIYVRLSGGGGQPTAQTGADGRFLFEGLIDGTYRAIALDFTFPQGEYFGELYDGFDCADNVCPDEETGTPIVVTLGSARTDIDFSLRRGGRFVGTVRAAATGLPVDGGSVTAFDAAGQAVRSTFIGFDGTYVLPSLPNGSYHLLASPQSSLLARELWPSFVCPTDAFCNPQQGTALAVAIDGAVTADFALDTLGRLVGRVVDAELGTPIGFGEIGIYGPGNTLLGIRSVDAAGRFAIGGLGAGSYRLRSFSNPSHIERMLGGQSCEDLGCDPASGTALPVQIGQVTTAPDFALSFGPGLAGEVRLGGVPAADVGIDVWSPAGEHLGAAASDAAGRWRIQLPAGSYYLSTDNGPAYVDEVYPGVSCPAGPAYLGLCDPLDGTPATVDGYAPATAGLDFDLAPRVPALFGDGFESGGFGAWSLVSGN